MDDTAISKLSEPASGYSYKEADPNYHGEPLDPLIKHGPIEHRSCRDIICCLIFLFVWVGVFIVAGYSFSGGNPSLLLDPFDSTGFQCGVSPGYQDYKYVYFNQSNSKQFACINICPVSTRKVNQSLCRYNNASINCTVFGLASTELIAKICYPSSSQTAFIFDIGLQVGQQWMSDLATTWIATICVFVMGFIVSLIFLVLTRFCTKFMVWMSIVLHQVMLIGFGVVTFLMAINPHFREQVTDYYQFLDPTYLKIVSYVLWSLAAISLIFMLCSIKKISTAINVIQFSTKMVGQMPSILFVPTCVTIVLFLILGFYGALFVYMFSDGTIVGCTSSPYGCVDWNIRVRRFFGFAAFGLLWNCLFIAHFTQFIISSVAAHWYFKSPSRHPILVSVKNMLLYHLGSIAFGAIVITIMSVFRIFLQLIYDCRPKNLQNNANGCKQCLNKCYYCFVCTFERFMQFVTRNAYVIMGITGQSFCNAAHTSFYLIRRHARSYLITHDLSSVLTIFAKLAIASLCSFLGYVIITSIPYFSDPLFSPTFPTVIFFIVSLVIASAFMDVLGNTNDSVLMCYLIGKELHTEFRVGNIGVEEEEVEHELVQILSDR